MVKFPQAVYKILC